MTALHDLTTAIGIPLQELEISQEAKINWKDPENPILLKHTEWERLVSEFEEEIPQDF